jgi:hypothetical protein
MRNVFLATCLALLAGSVAAAPLDNRPHTFAPYSRTATAIMGPIVASNERVIFFETGSILDLELVNSNAVGEWSFNGGISTAQVFAVSGDAGELLNGNRLCGGDTVSFMVAWEGGSFGTALFQVGLFRGDILSTRDQSCTRHCGVVFAKLALNQTLSVRSSTSLRCHSSWPTGSGLLWHQLGSRISPHPALLSSPLSPART